MSKKYWTDAWGLVQGCTPVSAACDNCWLRSMTKRFEKCDFNEVRIREDRLDIPLKTRKPRIYAIWSDLFHEKVPDDFRHAAYAVMALQMHHMFLILTKRPENLFSYYERCQRNKKYPTLNYENVWHGTTVENQATADKRIPELLKVPGKRFLSIEPMLGPIDLTHLWVKMPSGGKTLWNGLRSRCNEPCQGLTECTNECPHFYKAIHAVILGGETGPHARPMHPDWVRSVRDQCQSAGVPFFFKGWGGMDKN